MKYGFRYALGDQPIILWTISPSSRIQLRNTITNAAWWTAGPVKVNWEMYEAELGYTIADVTLARETLSLLSGGLLG